MDVWVNFSNATKWQAKGIFKCFFPYKSSEPEAEDNDKSKPTAEKEKSTAERNLPLPRRKSNFNIPMLSEEELDSLADKFAAAIPEDELSVRLSLSCDDGECMADAILPGGRPARVSS